MPNTEIVSILDGNLPVLKKYDEDIKKCTNNSTCQPIKNVLNTLGKVFKIITIEK